MAYACTMCPVVHAARYHGPVPTRWPRVSPLLPPEPELGPCWDKGGRGGVLSHGDVCGYADPRRDGWFGAGTGLMPRRPLSAGGDAVLAGETGIGKTLAYLVPQLHRILSAGDGPRPRVLILQPNRDLCAQVFDVAQRLADALPGPEAVTVQSIVEEAWPDGRADVLISTPPVAMRHWEQIAERPVDAVVLDEVDTLLSGSFKLSKRMSYPIERLLVELKHLARATFAAEHEGAEDDPEDHEEVLPCRLRGAHPQTGMRCAPWDGTRQGITHTAGGGGGREFVRGEFRHTSNFGARPLDTGHFNTPTLGPLWTSGCVKLW